MEYGQPGSSMLTLATGERAMNDNSAGTELCFIYIYVYIYCFPRIWSGEAGRWVYDVQYLSKGVINRSQRLRVI